MCDSSNQFTAGITLRHGTCSSTGSSGSCSGGGGGGRSYRALEGAGWDHITARQILIIDENLPGDGEGGYSDGSSLDRRELEVRGLGLCECNDHIHCADSVRRRPWESLGLEDKELVKRAVGSGVYDKILRGADYVAEVVLALSNPLAIELRV